MAERPAAGMVAKMAVDLKLAIEREGRLPEMVVLVFAEPEEEGQVVARVNEYERSARNEGLLDALRGATEPDADEEVLEMVDPYHPRRPNVTSKVRYGKPGRTRGERGHV